MKSWALRVPHCNLESSGSVTRDSKCHGTVIREGEIPVFGSCCHTFPHCFDESRCLVLQRKLGGGLHLMLNNNRRPIANKYREGKVQSTLRRGSKELEIAGMEGYSVTRTSREFSLLGIRRLSRATARRSSRVSGCWRFILA